MTARSVACAAASTPFEYIQVIKEATRFSLIDRTPAKKALDVHRLVQAVVKDTMDEPEQRAWRNAPCAP